LAEKVNTEYTKLVDKNMCSVACFCPLEATELWTSIPEATLREYGRVRTIADLEEEEAMEQFTKGPYDASVTPLYFNITSNIRTYIQCYNETLKPLFEEEEEKPEEEKDPKLKETMALADKFFDAGGYELLNSLEEKYNCGSIC